MRSKVLPLLALAFSALVFSGCNCNRTAMGPCETNVLGIAKFEKASYEHVSTNTFRVSSDEIYARNNFSGDKATFLWGLVTLTDY